MVATFFKRYLIFATLVCTFFSLILLWNCSCENGTEKSTFLAQQAERAGPAGPPAYNPPLPSTYLLIGIMSSPNESSVREVIRETWLKLSTKGPSVVRHFFPIGLKGLPDGQIADLALEQEKYGDLALFENLVDDYSLLSKKTLQTMEYAFQNYKFSYFLKVDSDSFVRLGAVIKSLKDINHPRLYWGFLDGRAKPIRKGKWKETDWVLCDRYLPYQLGGGYVLSYELVRFLSVNARMFKMYKSEDVSVGAWLAGLDIKYLHDPRFDTEFKSRGCNNQYIVTHKKPPYEMKQLYDNLVNKRVLCEKEFRVRASYVYDWAAVPSECCKRGNQTDIP